MTFGYAEASQEEEDNVVHIIPRSQWGARYKAGFGARALPTSQLWLHHSVTLSPDLAFVDLNRDGLDDDELVAMRTIEQVGQERFGAGFSYNVALMPSGRLYEGCGIGRVGAHTEGRNTSSMGLVLVGDYTHRQVTPQQLDTLDAFLRDGKSNGWLDAPKIDGGHRDLKSTGCPGDQAYRLIPAINARAARSTPTPPQEEDDMEYIGPQSSENAIKLLQKCLHREANLSRRDSPYTGKVDTDVIDGKWGPDTSAALEAYRKGKVLGYERDKVGGVTLALLIRYEN